MRSPILLAALLIAISAAAEEGGMDIQGFCQARYRDRSAQASPSGTGPEPWQCHTRGRVRDVRYRDVCRWQYGRDAEWVRSARLGEACEWARPSATLGDAETDRQWAAGYLAACARDTRDRRDWLWRSEKLYERCTPRHYWNFVRYWTYNDHGTLVVRIPLQLFLVSTRGRRVTVKDFSRDFECVQRHWQRLLGVRLEWVESSDPSRMDDLTYSAEAGRSDSRHIRVGDHGREPDPAAHSCRVLLHELGHRLGMDDRYHSPDECAGRRVSRPSDIMAEGQGSLDQLLYGLEDVQSTFRGFCGPIMPGVSERW
jgi:hypothetical protein